MQKEKTEEAGSTRDRRIPLQKSQSFKGKPISRWRMGEEMHGRGNNISKNIINGVFYREEEISELAPKTAF